MIRSTPYTSNQRVIRLYGRSSRKKVLAELRKLPRILAGKDLSNPELARQFRTILGVQLITKIYQAYLDKSTGGMDELGNRWQPLAASTIQARSSKFKELGKLGARKGGLSKAKVKERLDYLGKPIRKTKHVPTLGGQASRVPILRLTDRLLNSLTPGHFNASSCQYNPPTDQVFRLTQNGVKIGTSVPYGKWVHKKRPLWPIGRGLGIYGQTSGMSRWIKAITKDLARIFIHTNGWRISQ